MSEVALQQTPVPRVRMAWPDLCRALPEPAITAARGPAAVIAAWGSLGYPRRARRLWESARVIDRDGWPDELRTLPGVGVYTAAAVRAQADGWDVPAVDVNVRRVVERVSGQSLGDKAASAAAIRVAAPLRGRDRLLALMDLGATVCTRRAPACSLCPLYDGCATRGPRNDETSARQARYEGSLRQRRGQVLARLRGCAAVDASELDADALATLVGDGLAALEGGTAHLPRR